ncbi:matrixin family metalloprotease [Rheinheimera riviphila]|uniref:Matrixin family metalloprotease n=1 Tax=Rheinheimera riviphila TaxID=1834037 RepID=A0A437QMK7_9GAMM|nr:matrixin family metalloprotease [Rheinheimera riviphila]RVU35722.1 matrixin family metalloprotease [Rheinheimera riviphila]
MNFLIRLIFIAILVFLGWRFWTQQQVGSSVEQLTHQVLNPKSPYCQSPLGWRLGRLDPAFNLTEAQAIQLISTAADMWNQASGQQLLHHDPAHGFVIDFKFDARQQQLLKQRLLQRNLARYDDAIQPGLQNLPEKFAELDAKIAEFNQQKALLQQQISQFQPNAHNAEAQRRQLEQQQQSLVREADWLEQQRQQLMRDQDYLNETIRQRNELVQTAEQPTAAASFEVGLMTIKQLQRQMTIFAFSSETDLIATIAHEFGHAFGIAHTEEPDSIMFHQLNAQQQQLTAADIQAWQSTCQAQ